MRNVSKIVLVALATIVLVSGVAVLTPRAVHAVVATFVRDVDNAARHPWSSSCTFTTSSVNGSCNITIPPNVEVVLQMVSIIAQADPGNTHLLAFLQVQSGGVLSTLQFDTADTQDNQPVVSDYNVQNVVQYYQDPGTTITCQARTRDTNPSPLVSVCSLSGYTVSLP
ncbi:MAG TPA: hypothetical protein VGP62_26165 [Bryobacteraceae bacterium]|jgi:hypothetical protein|nr:hypothetical protein [Bryobacteraceae bacterium]